MPTYARGQIVVDDLVGVYHCIARCVRRAFLCGIDPYTGQDYSHRKEWILDRLRDLAGLFAIEVCGYSVMSNHLHLVGGNRARLRSTIQAGGGSIKLTRRCRGTPLAALVPGQGGRSNRLCVGHWLDTEPQTDISMTLSLEERGRLALTSLPGAVPTGQDEPFYVSRQVTTPIRWSS